MAATIKIKNGLTAGTFHQVEKRVTRIGSDTNNDICIPSSEIAPQAITLEFRDGVYCGYNRTRRKMHLNDRLVAVGEKFEWQDQSLVILPDGTELEMQVEGDPSPQASQLGHKNYHEDVEDVDAYEPDEEEGVSSGDSRLPAKKIAQVMMILGCLVATIWMYAGPSINKTTTDWGNSQFDQIVVLGLKDKNVDKDLLSRFRYFQAAMVREDTRLARLGFSLVAIRLHERENELNRIERAILKYSRTQMEKLKSEE